MPDGQDPALATITGETGAPAKPPRLGAKPKRAAAKTDLPAWSAAVMNAVPGFEVLQRDAATSAQVGALRGYRMVLRKTEPDGSASGILRPQVGGLPAAQERDLPRLVAHVDLVLIPAGADLPDRLAERIPWQELDHLGIESEVVKDIQQSTVNHGKGMAT